MVQAHVAELINSDPRAAQWLRHRQQGCKLHFSHFGLQANLLGELEAVFRDHAKSGTDQTRHYVHDEREADLFKVLPGTFTDWTLLPESTDLLFYEGLHGAVVSGEINFAQHADLKIGVVPVINLE